MFKIRAAVEQDYPQILDVYKELHEYRVQQKPAYFLETDVPLEEEEFKRLLADEYGRMYVVEQSGNILGFTIFYAKHRKATKRTRACNYLQVDELYVLERNRRAGIVQHLFEKIKRFAVRSGLEEIRLNLWEFDKETMDYYEERLRLTPVSSAFTFEL